MPSPAFQLKLRAPRQHSQQEEIDLARQTLIASPTQDDLRLHLATLLIKFDSPAALAEAIDHLRAATTHPLLTLLASALLLRNHPGDAAEALTAATQALELSSDSPEKSQALTHLGRAHIRLGRSAEGRSTLEQALQLDPANPEPFQTLNSLGLQSVRPDVALAAGRQAATRGATYAHVVSAEQIALARLGLIEKAHHIQGLDRFLYQADPLTPPGWPTPQAFHQALAQEILTHPDLRDERRDNTTNQTCMVNHPTLVRTPALRALDAILQREITAYATRLETTAPDPFVKSRPTTARLRSWCVIVGSVGHEEWHVHRNGWLSGVYYIHVPDAVAHGTTSAGCLTFGIPDHLAGLPAANAFGQRLIRPHTGLMVLFPSHAWHRTFPHGVDENRLCYSFDVNPILTPA